MAPATVPPDLTAGVLAAVESVASADARLAAGGDLATAEWGREMNGTHRSLPEPGREPVVGPTAVSSEKRPRRSAWSGWPLRVGFAAAFAAMTAAIVIAVGSDGSGVTAPVEIQGTLSGGSSGEIVVSELGSGREVELTSSELPILPKGELYEIWFVGPGDAPADPNRISGGTFHPDEAGNTDVTLHAAVDPALYPLIEITAEPGSGDPAKRKNQTVRASTAVDTLITITTSSTLRSWRESSSPRIERCQGMRTRTVGVTPASRA